MSNELTSHRDVYHRLERIEKRSDDMENTLKELTIHTSKIATILERYVDVESRVRNTEIRCYELEKIVSNNKIILSAIKWLAISVGGSATTIIIASFLAPLAN